MENEKASVTMRVRVGDSEVEISGPVDFVEKKIAEFLKNVPTSGTSQLKEAPTTPPSKQRRPQSPAQFFKSCNPRSDTARVLVAAYFLEKHRGAENMTSAEIRNLIREARV